MAEKVCNRDANSVNMGSGCKTKIHPSEKTIKNATLSHVFTQKMKGQTKEQTDILNCHYEHAHTKCIFKRLKHSY